MNEKSFEDYQLSEEVKRALSVLKYETPTEVQQRSTPISLGKTGSCRKISNRQWQDCSLWDPYL